MSEKPYLTVGSVIEPVVCSAIGFSAGYSLAPQKYSLKKLITLDSDTFHRQYPENTIKALSTDEFLAFNKITQARQEYVNSPKGIAEEIKTKSQNWKKEFNNIEISKDIEKEYFAQKSIIREKTEELNIKQKRERFKTITDRVKLEPDNVDLKKQYEATSKELDFAIGEIKENLSAYKAAHKKFMSKKFFTMHNNPEKYANAIESFQDLLAACAKRKTIMSNKLYEITNDKSIKECFNILKNTVPKSRVKSAITGAVILGSLSALIKLCMNKSVKNAA